MRRRVLIIDDEKTFADVLAELLADDGYGVVRAYDGISGIEMLSSEGVSPDVILCDVMLPGLSGDRVAAEIRRQFPDRRLPIVLLSASADPQVKLRDVWFMTKPVDCAELLDLIAQVVSPPVAVGSA